MDSEDEDCAQEQQRKVLHLLITVHKMAMVLRLSGFESKYFQMRFKGRGDKTSHRSERTGWSLRGENTRMPIFGRCETRFRLPQRTGWIVDVKGNFSWFFRRCGMRNAGRAVYSCVTVIVYVCKAMFFQLTVLGRSCYRLDFENDMTPSSAGDPFTLGGNTN